VVVSLNKLPINNLVLGDCIEVMKEWPRNSIDCVVTDPPFFLPSMHYQSRIKYQRNFADLTPLKVFWNVITEEVKRILKPTGHFIVFCNCDSYPVFYEPMYNNFSKLVSLIWNKDRIGLGRIWRHQHELIIAARNNKYKYNNNGKVYSDVITKKATSFRKRKHPVEKPWEIFIKLIEPITYEDDIILDPFCGSGTTCLAAKILKRKYIGIELNEEYVKIANELLNSYNNLSDYNG